MEKICKSIIGRLFRGLRAFFQEIFKPESFVKREAFENYVRNKIFPLSNYHLIYKTPNYNENRKDYIETTLYPDFMFREKDSDKSFFVEAKWRNGEYRKKGKIPWSYTKQLKRYKAVDKEDKVFIILGVGGKPSNPDKIALFPVSGCNYIELYDKFIDKYSIPVNKPVSAKYLWRLK